MSEEFRHQLEIAARRIEQLEAALLRRTELLEQRTAELANIRAGKAFKFANAVNKLINRFFPIHTRRRAMLRSVGKSVGAFIGVFLGRRAARTARRRNSGT